MATDVRILFELAPTTGPMTLADRLWSGEGVLTFEGEQWQGAGGIVEISAASAESGAPSSRFELSIGATDPSVRATTRDPGPRGCTIRWIVSDDDGATWTAVPRRVIGRLSAPQLEADRIRVTLELENGDRIPRAPVLWSDQDFRSRDTESVTFGGGVYLAELEAGVQVEWPNFGGA